MRRNDRSPRTRILVATRVMRKNGICGFLVILKSPYSHVNFGTSSAHFCSELQSIAHVLSQGVSEV